jgi:ketosteroid isomerase-like protein
MTNEEIVRAYARASIEADLETLGRLRHPDWTVDWPQTGERVRGSQAFSSIVQMYPGGTPKSTVRRIIGSEDRWTMTAANTVLRLAGEGEAWWGEWVMTYPDGTDWFCVDLLELRDGKVYRETVYWAPPLTAPEWRAKLVERIGAETP